VAFVFEFFQKASNRPDEADDAAAVFDSVFSDAAALRDGITALIRSRHLDMCFSLSAGSVSSEANATLSSHILGQLFGKGHAELSVSFLLVNGSSDNIVRDLLGSSGAVSTVTALKLTSVVKVMDVMQRYAPGTVERGECLVLTTSRVVGGVKTRVHITFGGCGVWEQAVKGKTGLLSTLASRCDCVRIASIAKGDFAAEWRRLFPMPVEKKQLSALQVALARIQELEEQLAEAKRHVELHDNTLINVLIGKHPAFQDLADYPKRKVREGEANAKENQLNRVEFHSSVVDNEGAAAPSSTKKPALARTLSNASSSQGPVRVAKAPPAAPTPAASRKKPVVKTPHPPRNAGVTPGGSGKSKSRIY
jgi:hypothetical protein